MRRRHGAAPSVSRFLAWPGPTEGQVDGVPFGTLGRIARLPGLAYSERGAFMLMAADPAGHPGAARPGQVTTWALIMVIGLPLGVAAGRWAWTLLARVFAIEPVPVISALVLLSVPAVLLMANLVAAVPGRAAARTRPAVVLRTE